MTHSVVFTQVIKYCEHHINDLPVKGPNSDRVEHGEFDVEFMKEVDHGTLFDLILVRLFLLLVLRFGLHYPTK